MLQYIHCTIVLAAFMMTVSPAYSGNDGPTSQQKRLFNGTALAGAFYENRGQIRDAEGKERPEIKYYAFCNGVQLYFTPRGWHTVYSVTEPRDDAVSEATGESEGKKSDITSCTESNPQSDRRFRRYRMDLTLIGCNEGALIEPMELQERHLNYYLAHCPDGITQVPGYGMLHYRNIYDNIDMILYASTDGLKYEFEIRPGGRVADIRLRHEGMNGIEEQEDGSLHVRWPMGYTREGRPYSYQEISGEIREVGSSWSAHGGDLVFAVDRYDTSNNLVLDPWSTYIGGHHNDEIYALACDSADAVYATGYTSSYDFPVYRAWQQTGWLYPNGNLSTDIIILRFDHLDRLSWSTFYGGSSRENGYGIATDPVGAVLVGGGSISNDFPVHRAFQSQLAGSRPDAILVKLDSTGSRIWATYFGGTGYEEIAAVGCDGVGNVYGAGNSGRDTIGTDIPLRRAFQASVSDPDNCFYMKMDSAGSLIHSSYIGGGGGEGMLCMAVYHTGEFLIGGTTKSYDFPVMNARQPTKGDTAPDGNDGFVTMIDSSGTPIWSTYHGGREPDVVEDVAIDHVGNIIATGVTHSRNFPTLNPFQGSHGGDFNDIFVSKFDSTGTMLFSTYYGGNMLEAGYATCTDSAGGIYVGANAGLNFPVHNAQYPTYYGGGGSGAVVKFDSAGQRIWATYLGGDDVEKVKAMASDTRGNIYVAGMTGSSNFPVFNAFQDSIARPRYQNDPPARDGFITRIRSDGYIPVTLSRLAAQRVQSGIRLDWCTESEVNAYGFIIERRYERESGAANTGWKDIGFVPSTAQGNEGRDYNYLDTDPGTMDTHIFYRLRMVDLDGTFEHSPVVEVAPESGAMAVSFETAYPAPARDWLTLNFSLPTEQSVTLQVHDITGREITSVYDNQSITSGSHSVVLPVGEWRSGLYLCTLTVDGRRLVRRAMVVR